MKHFTTGHYGTGRSTRLEGGRSVFGTPPGRKVLQQQAAAVRDVNPTLGTFVTRPKRHDSIVCFLLI